MIKLLEPETVVRRRPTDPEGAKYVRSYLVMRLAVGLIGVLLPLLLVLLDWGLFDGDPVPRDSLSAYYYSGMRELFVGALCATGVFLMTYKVTERTLDNTLSWVAGVAAVLVALWPTGRPSDGIGLTPLQDRVGEDAVQWIHFGSAAIFIVSLAVITFFFGVREGARPARAGNRPPAFWRAYHWCCAGGIVAALVWIVVTQVVGEPRTSLLIGEWAAVWAFGASWFAKGAEWDILRGLPRPDAGRP